MDPSVSETTLGYMTSTYSALNVGVSLAAGYMSNRFSHTL